MTSPLDPITRISTTTTAAHTRLDNLSPIRYEQHHQPAAQAA